MTSAGPRPDPHNAPLVRHRWMFITGIVFWVLLVIGEIFVVIRNLTNNAPLDLSFWDGPVTVVIIAAMLIRVGRLRKSAPR